MGDPVEPEEGLADELAWLRAQLTAKDERIDQCVDLLEAAVLGRAGQAAPWWFLSHPLGTRARQVSAYT